MKSAFIINDAMSMDEIKDALYQKITQVRGISSCLLITDKEIEPTARYGIVWAIDSLLEEIDSLIHHMTQTCPKTGVRM